MSESAASKGGTPVKKLLARKVSFFATVRRKRETACEITLGKFFDGVRGSRWRREVEAVRGAAASNNAFLQKQFSKDRLPAIKPSGLFSDLTAASLRKHSGVLCVDVDWKDNPAIETDERRQHLRGKLKEDPYVLGLHTSCGGKGLAVYVAVESTSGPEHRACFLTAEVYFRKAFGLTVDRHCCDVSRNRFVSFDPETWVRPGGSCESFKPAPAPAVPIEEGVSHNYRTLSHNSKNEFYPSSSSDGVVDQSTGIGTNRPTISDQSRFSAKLYARWVAHRPAVQGARNRTVCELAPLLTNIVGRDMVLTFLLKFYDDAASAFTDSREQHEAECRAMIEASLRSYSTNAKIGLNPKEREVYARIEPRRQDVFRITRSLGRISLSAGVFHLTDFHLGQRLGCDKTSAGRVLDYFVRDKVLELVERGEQWRPGVAPKGASYRWLLRSYSQSASSESVSPPTPQAT